MRPRVRAVVCACLLPVALLVVDRSGYSPFGPSKWAAITVVGLAAAAVSAAAGKVRVARWPALLWLIFLGWLVVSASVGLDPLYAWIGTPERHFGVFTWVLCALLFLAGHGLDDDGDARLVVGVGVIAGGLAGAWAVAEALGWRPVPVDAGSRLIGSMGSSSFLGAAMALVVPMAVGVAADRSWSRRYRGAAGLSAALATVALVGSGARAAWAGTILGLSVVVFVQRRLLLARLGRVAAAGALVVAAVVGLAVATGVTGRVPALFDSAGGAGSAAGGASRLDEWRVATRVVARHPLTGVGPEGYRIAFAQGVDAHYVASYGISPLPDRAHDSLLDVAATTGLPGVAVYIALTGTVAVFALRALRRSPPWLVGVAVGVIAYSAAGLALFPLAELEPAVWLLAGLLVAHTARPAELLVLPTPRPAGAAIAALAVVAAIAGGRDVLADRATRSALAALGRGEGPAAQRHAARAVALRPDQIEYRLAAERAEAAPETLSAIDRGLAQLRAALHLSPADPVLGDERGRLLLDRAVRSGSPLDLTAARAALERLVAANRFDAEDQLRLGVAAARAGDDRAAERAWLAADRLAPTSASAATDLATLYARSGRWREAAVAARRALARDPANAQAQAVLTESASHVGT